MCSVCQSGGTQHNTIQDSDNTDINTQKMMPYKLHLVFGIFSHAAVCVCVCHTPFCWCYGYAGMHFPVCFPSLPAFSCGGPAAPAIRPSTDTQTRPARAQVSPLTSPLSRFKKDSFVCLFLQVIVRSAS